MTWRDESWKDSYDSWKLRSPDEEYGYYEPEPCDHEDHETNILDGRCWCPRCGEVWHATNEEIYRQIQHEAEYHEWERRQARREFWRKLTFPIRWPIFRLLERFWPRKATKVLTDSDDIPF